MILCDAGVLLCLVDRTQPKHVPCTQAINRLAQPLITTWPCLTEAMYLALMRGSWTMQKKLGQLLTDGLLSIYEIQPADYSRILQLMEKYRDLPMDLADATLVLAAENTGLRQILTLDSDFTIYRINGRQTFEIIAV
ncbi:MAG: PIN domain-containing protein [Leptolyngbyaceae cyanobacterium SM2_5_2]|nr:PIN domain-containing protein [Leptolyngbyaceae cyanobacterium SM2_5_2]